MNEKYSDSVSFTQKLEEQNNILTEEKLEDFLTQRKPWWKVPHLLKLNIYIALITMTSTNQGYDVSIVNGLQSLKIWEDTMNNPAGAILGALTNGTTFGCIISVLFASYLCDKFGRKTCIYIGQPITLIGAILQGLSNSYGFFIGARIIIGIGVGLSSVASPTLISELSFPTHRGVTTSFYNVSWYLGAILASWVTFGTRNIANNYCWKIPSYLQGFFPLFQMCILWKVPESPRFLVSKGKIDEAERVLRKYHTGNSTDERDMAMVNFELKEINAAFEMEKLTSSSKYTDFLTIPSFRKRLNLIFWTTMVTSLSGNGIVAAYLNKVLNSIGITDTTDQLMINGCLMIYNFFLAAIFASVVPRFKRRSAFITCVSLMLLFYVLWTILEAINVQTDYKNKSLGRAVLAMIFLYYMSFDLGANGLPYLYVTEVLPYTHRAKGVNIFSFFQTSSMVYNSFVNSIGLEAIEWKYYIVYCCLLFVELLAVIFFFVETSGYTLEEVARAFGDDAETALFELSEPDIKAEVQHIE